MRIVIVGAGTVGSYLAQRLAAEGQDVVVVESDAARAAELQSTVDCLVVTGNGASPRVLEEAGIRNADLLIAVTSSDAANVLACHAGARMGVASKVARVQDPALRDETKILGVDVVIDPGTALARELSLLVDQGGASELVEFADGNLVLIGGYMEDNAEIVGITLAELRERVSAWDWLVVAIIRHGQTFIARGDTKLKIGDHVIVLAKAGKTDEAITFMGQRRRRARKVLIIGGTRLAMLTAEALCAQKIQTIVVDSDEERCKAIATELPAVIVAHGDPTDPKVLTAAGIDGVDVVLALTGWDEINILGCLVAKALGVVTTVARLARIDLVGLLPGVGIDAGVSSRLAAANEILRFVRRGQIHSVTTFHDSDAEAIELQVPVGSNAAGKSLAELELPKSVIVGGIYRAGEAFIPHGPTVILAGDTLILVASRKSIADVEELFG